MPYKDALEAVLEQLVYWERQRDAAKRIGMKARVAECERRVSQCEVVVHALRRAQEQDQATE